MGSWSLLPTLSLFVFWTLFRCIFFLCILFLCTQLVFGPSRSLLKIIWQWSIWCLPVFLFTVFTSKNLYEPSAVVTITTLVADESHCNKQVWKMWVKSEMYALLIFALSTVWNSFPLSMHTSHVSPVWVRCVFSFTLVAPNPFCLSVCNLSYHLSPLWTDNLLRYHQEPTMILHIKVCLQVLGSATTLGKRLCKAFCVSRGSYVKSDKSMNKFCVTP